MASNPPNQSNSGHKNNNKQSNDHANKNDNDSKKKRPIFDKSLGTAAGLSKLLPTGTTLAFQTMAPSFTKGGECVDHDVNFVFTWGLIGFLTLLSAALNFTDSVHGTDGNTHYGVVTTKGLWLFSDSDIKSKVNQADLERRRLKKLQDSLHAVVSAAVFLALAFCDAGVQRCLVKRESQPWKDFFNHLPLAVGFLASFVFIIFPSTRKGIGEDGAWSVDKDDEPASNGKPTDGKPTETNIEPMSTTPAKKERKSTTLLAAASTLSKLLPTGTTLAFQTMAPSFTNGGECVGHRVNFAFTWGLIGLLTLICALVSFTDSVTDLDGHTYYGVATRHGFRLFNHDPKELRLSEKKDEIGNRIKWRQLQKTKKIKARDFLHAVVRAAVFLALAFCDAGVQACVGAEESAQWKDFLTLLPLAVSFLASFVFVIFPSDRKGIGEEGAAFWHHLEEQEPKQPPATDPRGKVEGSHHQAMAAMSISRVAPSSEGHDGLHQPNSTPPPCDV